MIKSKARRIPIIADDDETKRAMVVSVLTQYRILKFVAVNVHETAMLRKSIKDLRLGTYDNLQWAKMDTPVIDVIHMLVQKGISSVPILDADGKTPSLACMSAEANACRCRDQCVRGSRRHSTHQRGRL